MGRGVQRRVRASSQASSGPTASCSPGWRLSPAGLCGPRGQGPAPRDAVRPADPRPTGAGVGWVWRSMAGGMARKRPPKQKKTHVGPALLHALSSGSNPLDVPFNSTRVSRGLGVTGSGSHPRPHAGRPPSGTGLDARPLLLSLHVGASRQQAQQRQNTAGTAQGCWALLTQGHHTPATEGGKEGAAAGEGRPVSRPPASWQRLPRVGAILTPSFGPRHQHREKVPGGGTGRERASGVATHRSVTAWPAGPWPGASLGCPGPGLASPRGWPSLAGQQTLYTKARST